MKITNTLIEKFILKNQRRLLKEFDNLSIHSGIDRDVNHGLIMFHSKPSQYQNITSQQASKLGFTVLNYLIGEHDFMVTKLDSRYAGEFTEEGSYYNSKGETFKLSNILPQVSFFERGSEENKPGTGTTYYKELKGHPAFIKWKNRITQIAGLVGWTFIDWLGSEDSEKDSLNYNTIPKNPAKETSEKPLAQTLIVKEYTMTKKQLIESIDSTIMKLLLPKDKVIKVNGIPVKLTQDTEVIGTDDNIDIIKKYIDNPSEFEESNSPSSHTMVNDYLEDSSKYYDDNIVNAFTERVKTNKLILKELTDNEIYYWSIFSSAILDKVFKGVSDKSKLTKLYNDAKNKFQKFTQNKQKWLDALEYFYNWKLHHIHDKPIQVNKNYVKTNYKPEKLNYIENILHTNCKYIYEAKKNKITEDYIIYTIPVKLIKLAEECYTIDEDYGHVFYNPLTQNVFVCYGDAYSEYESYMKPLMQDIDGVNEVIFEAEATPPYNEGWLTVFPKITPWTGIDKLNWTKV